MFTTAMINVYLKVKFLSAIMQNCVQMINQLLFSIVGSNPAMDFVFIVIKP
jgi:hypothetical protein